VRGKAVVTRIIELPQGPALLLDRELLKLSELAPGAEIEVTVQQNRLVLSPVKGSFDAAFLRALERGWEGYAETFQHLAE